MEQVQEALEDSSRILNKADLTEMKYERTLPAPLDELFRCAATLHSGDKVVATRGLRPSLRYVMDRKFFSDAPDANVGQLSDRDLKQIATTFMELPARQCFKRWCPCSVYHHDYVRLILTLEMWRRDLGDWFLRSKLQRAPSMSSTECDKWKRLHDCYTAGPFKVQRLYRRHRCRCFRN